MRKMLLTIKCMYIFNSDRANFFSTKVIPTPSHSLTNIETDERIALNKKKYVSNFIKIKEILEQIKVINKSSIHNFFNT